jgi:hypothetical protein
MGATNEQKARLFDLMSEVSDLVREGKRNPDHVADFLQGIKNDPNFYEALAKKPGGDLSQKDFISHPRIQELLNAGWKIEPGGVSAEGALDISRFELMKFVRRDEISISGTKMRKRAKNMGGLTGLDSAVWLLDNQEKIPKAWRGFYLAFPGALLRGSGDDLHVPCLDWCGMSWDLSLGWFGRDWFSGARVVRLRK